MEGSKVFRPTDRVAVLYGGLAESGEVLDVRVNPDLDRAFGCASDRAYRVCFDANGRQDWVDGVWVHPESAKPRNAIGWLLQGSAASLAAKGA